jgi:hypothetical protein
MNRFAIIAVAGMSLLAWAAASAQAPAAPAPGQDPSAQVSRSLADARAQLRIAERTIERIERELEALRFQDVDASVLQDYAIYLERVRAMTDAQRRIVQAMDAVAPRPPGWAPPEPELFRPTVRTPESELARLDRIFLESLAAFDEFLLEEQREAARRMEEIDEASSEEMTDLAREAAAAVERLREKGIDIDTSTPPEPGEGESEGTPPGETGDAPGGGASGTSDGGATGSSSTTQPGQEGEPGDGKPGDGTDPAQTGDGGSTDAGDGNDGGSGAGASGASDGTAPPAGASTPAGGTDPNALPSGDRPPANDDDIVARQLREAAERETDPELKEKLWQEYDKYKAGS